MIAFSKSRERRSENHRPVVQFQTGNDVLKALAMGAKAVGFASSMLVAMLQMGRRRGTPHQSITAELQRTMAATGCADLSSIDRSIVHYLPFMENGSIPR